MAMAWQRLSEAMVPAWHVGRRRADLVGGEYKPELRAAVAWPAFTAKPARVAKWRGERGVLAAAGPRAPQRTARRPRALRFGSGSVARAVL